MALEKCRSPLRRPAPAGRSPVCERLWIFRFSRREKLLLQVGQRCGFSLVCVRMWMSILYLLQGGHRGARLSSPDTRAAPSRPPTAPPCPPSPGIEASAMAGTALPVTAVPCVLLGLDVVVVDVIHQVLQELEELVTLWGRGAF